jgi:hypothetical protein
MAAPPRARQAHGVRGAGRFLDRRLRGARGLAVLLSARSGPARGGYASFAFATVNWVYAAVFVWVRRAPNGAKWRLPARAGSERVRGAGPAAGGGRAGPRGGWWRGQRRHSAHSTSFGPIPPLRKYYSAPLGPAALVWMRARRWSWRWSWSWSWRAERDRGAPRPGDLGGAASVEQGALRRGRAPGPRRRCPGRWLPVGHAIIMIHECSGIPLSSHIATHGDVRRRR